MKNKLSFHNSKLLEKTIIRQAYISDFPEIFSLWKKSGLLPFSKKIELEEFKMMLKLNSTSCLVLIKDNQIIGSIFGTFNGRRGWIYHFAIHPDFQHLG